MAGFYERDMNGLNDYLNTFMSNERRSRKLSKIYDGSANELVKQYNATEEAAALERESNNAE